MAAHFLLSPLRRTLAPRCSAQAPGVAVRFDHAAKTNRPAFLLCQCFVTLSAVVPCRDRPRSVPLVTGLCRSSGNAGKIAIAKGLLRAVRDLGPVCLLLDAWYMRGSLIRAALRLGHEVIGQVRRDTALFVLPPPRQPGRRGRSRLYGARLDADAVAALPASVHALAGYGGRLARLRHAVCRPRFLKGVIVRWCELAKGSGWVRLLLSTDPTLSAPVEAYAYVNELRPTLLTNVGSPWLQWPLTPKAARPSQPARPFGAVQKAAQRPCRVANTLIMGLRLAWPCCV